jgi:hypothetical protein
MGQHPRSVHSLEVIGAVGVPTHGSEGILTDAGGGGGKVPALEILAIHRMSTNGVVIGLSTGAGTETILIRQRTEKSLHFL